MKTGREVSCQTPIPSSPLPPPITTTTTATNTTAACVCVCERVRVCQDLLLHLLKLLKMLLGRGLYVKIRRQTQNTTSCTQLDGSCVT